MVSGSKLISANYLQKMSCVLLLFVYKSYFCLTRINFDCDIVNQYITDEEKEKNSDIVSVLNSIKVNFNNIFSIEHLY